MSTSESSAASSVSRPVVATAVCAAVFAVGALGFFGARAGLSVAVGGVAAVGNLVVLASLVRGLTTPAPEGANEDEAGGEKAEARDPEAPKRAGRRGGVAWAVLGVVKITVLFGGLWLLLTRGWVDPIGLVVGYGALPIGIAASTLGRALRP